MRNHNKCQQHGIGLNTNHLTMFFVVVSLIPEQQKMYAKFSLQFNSLEFKCCQHFIDL